MESSAPDRHPSVQHLLDLLKPNPNLPEPLALIARQNYGHALDMAHKLSDGAELSAGLRKLLEAKDCFVRQALIDRAD